MEDALATCAICSITFKARHSYGLCPIHCTKDLLREYDRVESKILSAQRHNIPTTLSLLQWISTLSDFKGLCAFCNKSRYIVIEMVRSDQGLTSDNVVPCCEACSKRRAEGYETAEYRVKQYLDIERVQHNITPNEDCEEPA